jgi:hypothetical protein
MDPQREAWILRFGLVEWKHKDHRLSWDLTRQLSQCKGDEQRRLILGISR